jgi:copper chaperone NosL
MMHERPAMPRVVGRLFPHQLFPLCLVAVLLACAAADLPPAPLDTRHEQCAKCRMTVSSQRFASQIVAPGEEPVFFDDLGCLRKYIAEKMPLPAGAVVYVADHRTAEWAPGRTAVFTRAPQIETPMSSHLVAHASAASRDDDPGAREGTDVARTEILGAYGSTE